MKTSLLAFAALTLFTTAAHADFVIDTSGYGGANGANGRNGYGTGDHGTSAGRSTPGGDASSIDVSLTDTGDGVVRVSGTRNGTFSTGSGGQIVLRANGGNGGNGGSGGNGSTGYTGSRGHDATRYSSGSNGGQGGPGGDGGDGTSGSNGGAAGTIVVRVKEKDMHLLYLLATPSVSGGAAGARGSNGQGGLGGPGGQGGSSYSWQEPYTSTCSEDYTGTCSGTKSVSGGNGTSTTVSYDYSCTKTRSVSCTKYRTESNPGGYQGPTGSSGRNGSAYLNDGLRGRDGSYKYVVEYRDGHSEEYTRAFDLAVTGFQLSTDFSDEFVQPGEKMKVTGITIANRGGMPSPTMTPIRFRADSDAPGAVSSAGSIDLKTSIPAGGSTTVVGSFDTEILRDFIDGNAAEGKHLGGPKRDFKFGVSAEIVGIHRYPNRLSSVKDLLVRYPIEISRVLGKRSIGQGDDYLFRWGLDNFSKAQLGEATTTHRHVRFVSSFSFKSGAGSDAFVLKARGSDDASPGAQKVEAIPSRKSGGGAQESPLLWAKFGFTRQAKLLDEGTLKIVAQIEDPYVKDKWVTVDVAYFPIKVGNPFDKTDGADVLLVTSPQTTESELKAWKELFASANRKADVWDVGIMGALDIGRAGMAEHYKGGTIVVLNDLMKQNGDESVPVDAMFKLAPSDFIDTLKENHIGLFVFDRTGSYKSRAGGFGSIAGRTLDSPMLVANKLTEDKFKDVAYINGDENRVSFAMALSFNRKLEEFAKASANVAAATAYGDAILNDLAVEQIFARTPGNKQDLPLLGRLVEHGLINPIAASDDANLALPDVKLVLELLARVEFLADSQVSLMHGGLNPFQTDHEVTKATHKLIEQFLAKTFTATDGWFDAKAKKTAYKKVTSALEKRVEELKTDADKLGDLFRDQDKSRYFTFPRAWSGDYYRQAAFSVLVRPVFNRTYTHKMEVFNAVLEKERQALPAFN